MPYTQSIVTEIRRKTSEEFETPVSLGSKQKNVSPLLNSHNNNLEEQSILGVDCYTIIWTDIDNVVHTTKKFYNGDLSTVSNVGYYILFIEDYSESTVTDEFYFRNNGLYLPIVETSKAEFGSDNNIYLKSPDIYTLEDDLLNINPVFKILQKETLCFRKNILDISDEQISSDILISTKITSKKIDDDGKIYFKDNIINYLND